MLCFNFACVWEYRGFVYGINYKFVLDGWFHLVGTVIKLIKSVNL